MSGRIDNPSSHESQKLDDAVCPPGHEVDVPPPVRWWCNLWWAGVFGGIGIWVFPVEPPRSRWALGVSIGCVFVALMMVGLRLLRMLVLAEPQYYPRPGSRAGQRDVSRPDESDSRDIRPGPGV